MSICDVRWLVLERRKMFIRTRHGEEREGQKGVDQEARSKETTEDDTMPERQGKVHLEKKIALH